MTTVIAAAADGVVYMAADTLTNVYDRPIVGSIHKIIRVPFTDGSGEALVAFAGNGALPGAIGAGLKIKRGPKGGKDPQPWAYAVACAITQLAVEAGLVESGCLDGIALLGWGGHVWTVFHGGALLHPDGRAAIGSGEGPAIGALDALLSVGESPADAVVRAVEIAVDRDKHSGLPLQLEILSPQAKAEGKRRDKTKKSR